MSFIDLQLCFFCVHSHLMTMWTSSRLFINEIYWKKKEFCLFISFFFNRMLMWAADFLFFNIFYYEKIPFRHHESTQCIKGLHLDCLSILAAQNVERSSSSYIYCMIILCQLQRLGRNSRSQNRSFLSDYTLFRPPLLLWIRLYNL